MDPESWQTVKTICGAYVEAILIIGIIGNAICIHVFRRLKEHAYKLQLALMVSELLSCLWFIQSSTDVFFVAYAKNNFSDNVMRSYPAIWYISHFLFPPSNMFFTSTVWILLFICIDRIIALAKPVLYSQVNHRRMNLCHYVCIGFSFVLGVTSSIFDCFRFYPALQPSGLWFVAIDTAYIATLFANFSNWFRTIIRLIPAALVFFLNICIIILYKRLPSYDIKQQKHMIACLLLQSLFTVLAHAYLDASFLGIYYYPTWILLKSYDMYRVLGCTLFFYFASACNFFVFIIVSKSFRKNFLLFVSETFGSVRKVFSSQQSSVITPNTSHDQQHLGTGSPHAPAAPVV